jgi:IS30 family transposase
MSYRQITREERYALAALRGQRLTAAEIARATGRHRSTIGREVRRNATRCDGSYRPELADTYARGRRSYSRRNRRFTREDFAVVAARLRDDWSPEQIAGRLRLRGGLRISHETIYRFIAVDQRLGGGLYRQLRGARKQRRKRYRSDDSRGRLPGKRPITARPAIVETRAQIGHWEADTVLGTGRPCVLSLVERKTGFLLLGKLEARTTAEVNRRAKRLIQAQRRPVRTITADNGTEFHGYAAIERVTPARFYFATPHHAWERGTNENTNGLLRQYLPKRCNMTDLSQVDCTAIAAKLNGRPRKRLGYKTPAECYTPR